MCTSSPEVRDSWLQDYMNAMVKLKAPTETGAEQVEGLGSSVSELSVAPIWRPDETSGLCSRCNVQFSLLVRRHHCRKCGNIVCDNCSKDRVILTNINNGKPARVCAPCKAMLSGDGIRDTGKTTGSAVLRRPSATAPPPVPPPE